MKSTQMSYQSGTEFNRDFTVCMSFYRNSELFLAVKIKNSTYFSNLLALEHVLFKRMFYNLKIIFTKIVFVRT